MRVLLMAGTVVAAGAAVALAGRTNEPPAPGGTRAPLVRGRAIAFHQTRIARDSFSAGDFAALARLELERSRESGEVADIREAERHARRSLALRDGRNTPAFFTLVASLLAQHRFPEALDVARRLVARDSASAAARALLGETQYEMGRYAEAAVTFRGLETDRTDLRVAPRLARWEELRGRPGEARRLLRAARDTAAGRYAMPAEQLAWLHFRLGDLALRYGHRREAARELRAGLAIAPDDHRLLAAMARLEAARGRRRRAIAFGERSVAAVADPAALAMMVDIHAAAGDSAKAREYGSALAAAVRAQPEPFERTWSFFQLEHGRDADAVVARARAEVALRPDVYGYDLLAWALHKRGDTAGARAAMARALALGTRDPALLRHAAEIARGRGRGRER